MRGGKPGTRLDRMEKWPHPFGAYLGRVLWLLTENTLWRLAWERIHVLRPLLLKLFGAKVPLKSHFGSGSRVQFPWMLECGEYSAVGPRVNLYNLGGIRIGKHVIISQDAYLCGGTHDYKDPLMPLVRKPIVVGDQAWICAGAFIGPGVTVGEGAVVGARACVMRDVPPWTVVAGNPARRVRKRVLSRPAERRP